MRRSTPTMRIRLARAGIATGAAAAVVFAAAPALAANVPVTLNPATGVTGGGETITATAAGFLTGITTPATVFSTAPTCPATYPTGSGSIAAPTTKTSDGTATITVPAGVLAPTTYRLCIYAGNVANTSAIAGNASGFTATPAAPTVAPSSGPVGGGNQITLTAPTGWLAGTGALAALFSTTACTPTFGTPAAGSAAPVTRNATNTVGTVTVPGSVTAPTAYTVCVYAGTGVDSALLGASAGPYAAMPPMATLSPSSGMSGGGGMITATSTVNFLSGVAAPGALFVPAPNACPPVYQMGGLAAGGVNRMSDNQVSLMVPPGVTGPGAYTVCFYNGTTATGTLIGVSGAPYTLSFPPVMLSARVGPTGGLNTITASSTAPFLTGVTTPGAVFTTATACQGTYSSSSTPAAMTGTALRISASKAAITVPAGLMSGSQYSVCLYAGIEPNSGLIANSPTRYTVAPPTVVTGVSPGSGPAMGGTKVTVSGSGFPTEPGSIAATVGGAPLMSIMPMSPTQFTAVMPAHTQGTNLPFKVTTAAGTFSWAPGFTYSNGIVISPNTASNKDSVYVDIMGVDFTSIDFSTTTGTTSTDTNGHIYLVDLDAGEMYDAGEDGNAVKETPPAAECTNVLVVSDDEVICRLTLTSSLTAEGTPAAGTPVLDGAYNLTVVSNGQVGAEDYTMTNVSSGSTFTVADY